MMEPKFMELLGSIPTSCDTTIVIDAKVGEYIITTRRKGNDWFIAGMTDSSSLDINIDLSFLSSQNYNATICKDGINADRNAMDYMIEEKTLTANDSLQIHMAPAGGFLVRLRKD
jgi:alpha-glucosidase